MKEAENEDYQHYEITNLLINILIGGARGVMVIVTGYGHGDTSSNPGPD